MAAIRFILLFSLLGLCRSPSAYGNQVDQILQLDLRAALADEDDQGTRWAYDAAKAIGALQGIVNRETPELFVIYLDNAMARERGRNLPEPNVDRFWFQWLREEGRMLADSAIEETTDIWVVFDRFHDDLKGMVLWDEAVPSTANVASTIAGSDDLLPIRGSEDHASFHQQFVARYPNIPVERDLRGMFTGEGAIPETTLPSSGSAKCDAYLWAIEKFLKTGMCSSEHLAYYIDGVPWNNIAPNTTDYPDLGNAGVLNADYWISRKAFFFDLSPWDDHPATDDRDQPVGADYRTLTAILFAANNRNGFNEVITCGGFVPWWLKYCRADWGGRDPNVSPHDPVPTEWRFVDILSAYNTVLDADAFGLTGLANASVYRHFPLEERYEQNPKPPARKYDPNTTYVLFAMLDYDSAAWLAQMFQANWQVPERGELPLLWGINPILSDRCPMVFDAIYKSLSPNDWIGADEGLGYITPNLLEGDRVFSNLRPFGDRYLEIAKPYFEKFSMTHTAFVITGHQGKATERALEILAQTSPDGVGFQAGKRVTDGMHYGVAFKEQEEDWNWGFSANAVANRLENKIRSKGLGSFLFFRCILMNPTQIVEGVNLLKSREPDLPFEVLDPHTYFGLIEERHLAGKSFTVTY